jgi:hypothetical protein
MPDQGKKTVSIGPRLAKFIGSKATREKKMQAAAMQAEFTLHDTLIILCYLSRDEDPEIATQARTNLIPAARTWYGRPDRPELPEPIHDIVIKVIDRVGLGEKSAETSALTNAVQGHVGLLGLGEIIQAVDHNNRTVAIKLERNGETSTVYTENGKVVWALSDTAEGLPALHQAFGWADATFSYLHASPPPVETPLKINTLNLVMDALEYAPDDDPYDTDVSLSWKVEGNLEVMNIFELAEIFEMNSKQAQCVLTREDQEGILYFNQGRVVNASLNEMTGMDAACHLLAWPSAHFLVSRGGEGIEEVIHAGMQNLIIEAMRLLDEGVTVSDRIANELALINELFEGKDVVALPVLDRVRIVFGKDDKAAEVLETDSHPLVRKAIKVKISKTVHKYLSVTTDHEVRLNAARGHVPLTTTEKLVLLTYLSHDESEELRQTAKETLTKLDATTYRKGFGSDLHPSVMDFLVRETIKDETLIRIACTTESLMEQTALFIIERWQSEEVLGSLASNTKLLERSDQVARKLWEAAAEGSDVRAKVTQFEQSLIDGNGSMHISGDLHLCGLYGLMHAASVASRSGTVGVEGVQGSGKLFFRKGKVIGVQWGDLQGEPALSAMLKHDGLKFRYLLRTHFHEENIEPATAESLLNAPEAGSNYDGEKHGGRSSIGGSPSSMDLFEFLTLFEGTSVPVQVTVVCEEGSGTILRDKSRILDCTVQGKETPYNAMAALLTWQPKRYLVRVHAEQVRPTVDRNLGDFFTEAMREIPDEMKELRRPGELPEWELSEEEAQSLYNQILTMGVAEKIKLAFTGNKEARDILVRDSNKLVSVAVVKSPKIQEAEIEAIAKSRSVAEEVLRTIGTSKEWLKSYSIKVNLCNNSKTPIPIASKLVPQLRDGDLAKLAKSKNVSAVVSTIARRLVQAKKEKSGP